MHSLRGGVQKILRGEPLDRRLSFSIINDLFLLGTHRRNAGLAGRAAFRLVDGRVYQSEDFK